MNRHKNDYALAIHAGAGPDDKFIRDNREAIEKALAAATNAAHGLLDHGGSAVEAVELAIQYLEDNPLFNAGCGSALNADGETEMCASIMEGKELRAGAVAMVRRVKNPILVARKVMEETDHVFLGGEGALNFAKMMELDIESKEYFITPFNREQLEISRKKKAKADLLHQKVHSTVGAVALDKKGNVAAGTSSGGTSFDLPGRIGDGGVLGSGCYANNKTCAVSITGDGEIIARYTIASHICAAKQYTRQSVQQCVDYVIHHLFKDTRGDLGAIAIDTDGDIGITFNSDRMLRAWIGRDGELQIKIYE